MRPGVSLADVCDAANPGAAIGVSGSDSLRTGIHSGDRTVAPATAAPIGSAPPDMTVKFSDAAAPGPTAPPRASGDAIPDSLLVAELERIAASDAFKRSPLQLKLLRHLVREAERGGGRHLTETALAIDVLGADPRRFDAARDTSVRVTMRRLRQRLARYYADEGAWSTIEIELPVGHYQPRFRMRRERAAAKPPSIAVLPLRNFTSEPVREAWCDGVSEEITDALIQVPGLRVATRTSAFRFRHENDLRAIGKSLGVATLIDGSVQGGQHGLRAVVQWIRTSDGNHVWSSTLDADPGEADPAFALRVAQSVVAGLQRHLLDHGSPTQQSAIARSARRSTSDIADERYHSARYLMRAQTADGYARAIEPLRAAIAADPEFALARSALAHALVNLVGLTLAPPATLLADARSELARALEIDPRLGEAHALDGFIAHAFDHDWPRAEHAFLRGIRFAPSLCYAHSAYAWALMMNGRFEDADSEYRYARSLEPLDLKMRAHHALVALYAGDDDRALAELSSLAAIEPGNVIVAALLATTHLWRGSLDDARAAFEKLARDHPAITIGEVGLAQIDALEGRTKEARRRLSALKGDERRYLPPYQAAMIHARLDEHADAIDWLERSSHALDMNFVCAPVDRTFTGLHDDPNFVAMLERNGLRAVWKARGRRPRDPGAQGIHTN